MDPYKNPQNALHSLHQQRASSYSNTSNRFSMSNASLMSDSNSMNAPQGGNGSSNVYAHQSTNSHSSNNSSIFQNQPSELPQSKQSHSNHQHIPSSSSSSAQTSNTTTNNFNYQNPQIFVGLNLPSEKPGLDHPFTDSNLVEQTLNSNYDMITSRISSPNYRIKIEALFQEIEDSLMSSKTRNSQPNKSPNFQHHHQHQQQQQQQSNRPVSVASSIHSLTPSSPLLSHRQRLSTSSNQSSNSVINNNNNSNALGSPILMDGTNSPAPSLFANSTFSAVNNNNTSFTNNYTTYENSKSVPPESIPFNSFQVPSLELDDILLIPGPHLRNVIAVTAPWVELDSKNQHIAALSIQVLLQEIAYASYCGVSYLIIAGPKRRTNVEQYSQAISQILSIVPSFVQVIINLPFAEDDYVSSRTGVKIPPADYLSIWDVWNTIRTINCYPSNLYVSLQVPPKCKFPPTVLTRWYSEPVKMLIISSACFMPNAKGYPVLPKASQSLLFKFFKKKPFVIISDVYDKEFIGGPSSYLLYIRHLLKIRPKPASLLEMTSDDFKNRLQLPLQPLADNLENATYEIFEQDPVKYSNYEKAITSALKDIPKQHVYVAVAGAGRGPLVERTLKAALATGKTVHIFAIEKNLGACIHLSRRQEFEWTFSSINPNLHQHEEFFNEVEIVQCDIRSWKPPNGIRVQLIVSELLGSFGDNELSPECLDALDNPQVLDQECGIMIPSSYTAYFTPIMAPVLYSEATNFRLPSGNNGPSIALGGTGRGGYNFKINMMDGSGSRRHGGDPQVAVFHTPYVVMMNEIDHVAPSQFAKAWTFVHPSPYGTTTSSTASNNTPATKKKNIFGLGIENNYETSTNSRHSKSLEDKELPAFMGPLYNSTNNPNISFLSSTIPENSSNNKALVNAAISSALAASQKNFYNTRKVKHTFHIPSQAIIHGFAGYFECTLYKDIGLSTVPPSSPDLVDNPSNINNNNNQPSFNPDGFTSNNASTSTIGANNNTNATSSTDKYYNKDLVSWFPIWFPIATPFYVTEQSELDISIWRMTNGSRVWYEWCMESFLKPGALKPLSLAQQQQQFNTMYSNNNNSRSTNVSETTSPFYSIHGDPDDDKATAAANAKYMSLQAKRRVRTHVTQIHNSGGFYFSMNL